MAPARMVIPTGPIECLPRPIQSIFTRETGIRVNLLPSPDSARQRLVLWRELLETGASGPDVYAIDVIWPGMLAEYFVDLMPYFATEVSLQFPAIAAGYTVG